ncbi:MAG: hypothetical protein RL385_268 [Pseudomonadota bacterium]|jgi:hypothetical protein
MTRCASTFSVCALSAFVPWSAARAEVRTVGPGKDFSAPCAAFAAAADGDTIAIDAAGAYAGDVCAITRSGLTIVGMGGRAHIDAGGKSAQGKAIWVVQGSDTTVEHIELSGCVVPDKNGAGIRQEGRNLTVRDCFFHHNENGILTGADSQSVILIESSEFADNGAGDGYSHNMYVGEVKRFTLRGSYSHGARSGHLVKSRALQNDILYNRLSDEGPSSYELDLPQGGPSVVLGNVFYKSAAAENGAFISYGRESKRNVGSALWLASNTFFHSRASATFVAVAPDLGSVTLRNNIFGGPGTVCDLPHAVQDGNLRGDGDLFVDAAGFDFHLRDGSAAVDQGAVAGTGGAASLSPECQYAHPAHAVVRNVVGRLDQGAFELGTASLVACGGAAAVDLPDAGVTPVSDASAPVELARDDSSGRPEVPVSEAPDSASTSAPKPGDGCRAAAASSGAAESAVLSLLVCAALFWQRRRRG